MYSLIGLIILILLSVVVANLAYLHTHFELFGWVDRVPEYPRYMLYALGVVAAGVGMGVLFIGFIVSIYMIASNSEPVLW